MPHGFTVSAAKCAADSRQHPGEVRCRLMTDRPGLKAESGRTATRLLCPAAHVGTTLHARTRLAVAIQIKY